MVTLHAVIEKAEHNYSAYVEEIDGVVQRVRAVGGVGRNQHKGVLEILKVACHTRRAAHAGRLAVDQELMDEIEQAIASITDAQGANEVGKNIGKTQVIWDSKVRARVLFKAKLDELKLKYNTKTKQYEPAA